MTIRSTSSVVNPSFYDSRNAAAELRARLLGSALYSNPQSNGFDASAVGLVPDANIRSPVGAEAIPDSNKTVAYAQPMSSVSGTTNTGAEIGKSFGVGVAKGLIGLMTLPGAVGSLVDSGIDYAGNKIGATPEQSNAIKNATSIGSKLRSGAHALGSVAGAATDYVGNKLGVDPDTLQTAKDYAGSAADAYLDLAAPSGHLPRPEDLQREVEHFTGKFYQPQSIWGERAQTAGEFIPALFGGPETLGPRLLYRYALPALASEAAGEATKGTAAEPYARLAGGLVGGLPAFSEHLAGTTLPRPDYPLPKGARIVGDGPSGPVVDGLQNRYDDAVRWLRNAKTGDVKGALTHPDVQEPIDLIYGNKGDAGKGVAHIDERHPNALNRLPDVWDSLSLAPNRSNKSVLENEKYRAVIPNNLNGDPKSWLLTAFERPKNSFSLGQYFASRDDVPWFHFPIISSAALSDWDKDEKDSQH